MGTTNGAGKNGSSNGHGMPPDDDTDEPVLDPGMGALEAAPPPPEVAELAASCVRFVASKYKVPLDFQPETLSLLDQWIKDARAEVTVRPEATALVVGAAGAYFGEVIRRRFGGYWKATGDQVGWRVMFSRVYLAFNPVGMALEALELREAEGWHAHFELDPGERDAVEQRLAAMPDVDEEEYYAPTTRFDVIEAVVETLLAQLEASGMADVRYEPEDYG